MENEIFVGCKSLCLSLLIFLAAKKSTCCSFYVSLGPNDRPMNHSPYAGVVSSMGKLSKRKANSYGKQTDGPSGSASDKDSTA